MAFPAPTDSVAVPDETITGTPKSIDLPSGNDGDLLLMWIWMPAGNNVAVLVRDSAGFSTWTDIIGATGNAGCQMWAKFLDADGFDSSVECVTHNGSTRQAWFYAECFGASAHPSTLPAGANGLGTGDPPSLNPANWDVEDTLWRAMGCSVGTLLGTPTGYTTVYNPSGAIYLGEKQNAVASEDPSDIGSSGDASTGTVAIRPAAAEIEVTGTGVLVVRSSQRWR